MQNTGHIKLHLTAVVLFFLPLLSFSQIPTIKAHGGEGKIVDWPKIRAQVEKEEKEQGGGPGFFYNPCAEGANPLRASSTLANQGKYNYKISNISDFDPMTAWVEGNPDYGIGQFFEVKAIDVSVIYNGYQASPKTWIENSRVKRFKVYKNNVPLCFLDLTDEMGAQYFELPGKNRNGAMTEKTYKFEIVEVYKGTKWSDVAISELFTTRCCVAESTLIKASNEEIGIAGIEKGQSISTINIETGELSATDVQKVYKQRHLSLLKIKCDSKELELTSNHPLYIKDFGFSSINRYMEIKKVDNYADLIDKIYFGLWDDVKGKITYAPLKEIQLIEGDFETYTIGKIGKGETFITNGFITKVY